MSNNVKSIIDALKINKTLNTLPKRHKLKAPKVQTTLETITLEEEDEGEVDIPATVEIRTSVSKSAKGRVTESVRIIKNNRVLSKGTNVFSHKTRQSEPFDLATTRAINSLHGVIPDDVYWNVVDIGKFGGRVKNRHAAVIYYLSKYLK